ncbi:MAG: choice-of-anchor D domain-containing protein, partial [Desulfobacterales bacterium]|nr:choice-of-anchor D domain-containing protein [Desulfobacterales bacterium]
MQFLDKPTKKIRKNNPLKKRYLITLWMIFFFFLSVNAAVTADEVSYGYNDLGRLVNMTYKDGYTVTQVTYQYDHAGNFTTKDVTHMLQDADLDLIPDAWETEYGLDPNSPGDAGLDPDLDGLTNLEEYNNGTSPLLSDTDNDGYSDSDEILAGTDPLDSSDFPGSATGPATNKMGLALLSVLFSGLGFGFLFRFNRATAVSFVCGLMVFTAAVTGHAEPAGPGWIDGTGEQITPESAKAYYQSLGTDQARTADSALRTLSVPASASPEITELARGLEYDPKRIFEYVRNHVDYVPYFGSLKGAVMTFLDGAGNDFDQASLMIALLQASGYSAQYVYGTMQIPNSGAVDQKDMQHWLGVDPDNAVIYSVLGNGGIPASQAGAFCELNRVWVSANIGGSTYLFDPAFKVYQETPGINLAAAMGYNQPDILAAAGGTTGPDYIQHMNESGLRTLLGSYSTNLYNHIRNTYPNAEMEEIINGREIIPEYISELPTSLPFTSTPQFYWDTVPATYVHTIRIRHGEIDETLDIPDLSGKRLSMTYEAQVAARSAAQNTAQTIPFEAKSLETAVELPDLNVSGVLIKEKKRSAMTGRSAGTWDFGRIPANASSQGTLNMTNPNPVAIQLIVSLTSNPQNAYSITAGSGTHTVGPGASHAISVKFNSTGQAPGTKTGQLRIEWWYGSNNFSNTVYNLTGVVAQAPSLDGSYGFNFGQVYFNSPKDGVCRIKNSGSLNMSLTSIGLSGADAARFQLTGGTGTGILAPGQYRDINVHYPADSVGSHTAAVLVNFTYDGVPQGINLSLAAQTLSPPVAQLWLDDTLIAQETAPVTGPDLGTMFLTIDHPYSGDGGSYADQSVEYPMKRGSFYTIIYDFGSSRDGRLLENRQRQMKAYRRSGLPDTSREVVTETLNVMGMAWMRDTTLNENLLENISNILSVRHHRFGVVAQEDGYYIDVKAQQSASVSRSNDDAARKAHFKAMNHMASALEHGVLEQMQVNRPAVSTAKLLQLTNEDGDKVFQVTAANFSTVEPQLFNYSDADKQAFQQSVNAGNTLILPANGRIVLQQWGGKGYIDYNIGTTSMHCGMIIGGDHFGGYGVIPSAVNIEDAAQKASVQTRSNADTGKVPSLDPVDMTSGYFMYDNTDLVLSGGMGGMVFKRSYFG